MKKRIPLMDMKPNESGTVVEILGDRGVHNRLKGFGIRNGVEVSKANKISTRGPVILHIGGSQTALGTGVAYKVIIEVER
ncbi:ferrous iron transport protein A [Candidatus Auribacterota bacterium]